MNVVNTKESDSERRYMKIFNFDNTIQIDSLIELIKKFENDQIKMFECNCYTYDADDHPLYYGLSSLDDIKSVYDSAASPYFDFSIDFVNREDLSYMFSLVTSINSNSLIYEVDKKKLASLNEKSRGSGRR